MVPQQPLPAPPPYAAPAYPSAHQHGFVGAGVAPPPPQNNALIIGLIVGVLALLLLAMVGYMGVSLMSKSRDDTATNTAAPLVTSSSRSTTAGPPAGGGASGPTVGAEVIKYVTAAANIRSVATAQTGGAVGTLRRGEQVKGVMVQGLSGNTFWFKLSDGRGYVSAVNLGDADPGPAPPPVVIANRVPVPNAPYCTVATNSGNLRIRASPNGRIIGGMPRGARFQAYNGTHDAYDSYWIMVQPVEARYPAGWVSGDYVIC